MRGKGEREERKEGRSLERVGRGREAVRARQVWRYVWGWGEVGDWDWARMWARMVGRRREGRLHWEGEGGEEGKRPLLARRVRSMARDWRVSGKRGSIRSLKKKKKMKRGERTFVV